MTYGPPSAKKGANQVFNVYYWTDDMIYLAKKSTNQLTFNIPILPSTTYILAAVSYYEKLSNGTDSPESSIEAHQVMSLNLTGEHLVSIGLESICFSLPYVEV